MTARKIIVIGVLVVIFGIGSFVGFLILTDRIMIRPPVLVQQSPKITFAVGDAYYRSSPVTPWEQAIVGQELGMGSEVRTEKNASMDIRFHDDMAVKVVENSIFKIDEMTVRKIQLSIEKGSVYGKFEKVFKDYVMEVKTPTTIAGIRGTELRFTVDKKSQDDKKKKKGKDEDKREEEKYETAVYCLSGITELSNPEFKDQKVLLSYQKKLAVRENEPPEDPEKMTEPEIADMRSKLNSIHLQEVLFISNKINFELGSAKILPESHEELDKVVKILKRKSVKIRIEGHTDIQGGESFNQTLSVERARSIKEYFTKQGIEAERIEIAGFGASKPVADNKTKEGRALNRRVEFIVIDD